RPALPRRASGRPSPRTLPAAASLAPCDGPAPISRAAHPWGTAMHWGTIAIRGLWPAAGLMTATTALALLVQHLGSSWPSWPFDGTADWIFSRSTNTADQPA